MKVIIIGAGIGGLSAYHAIKKYVCQSESESSLPVTVHVYEAHNSPATTKSTIGGGIGLAPNGVRALSLLSPSYASYIQARGFCGAIFTMRNSTGQLLGRYWNGRKERYGVSQIMLPRAVIHDALLGDLPQDAVSWGKKVAGIRERDGGVDVEFADGTTETADLVIGADGVKSVIRHALFGEKFQARYDGFTGVGGFIPVSSLPQTIQDSLQSDPVTMTFGARGFFGYARADSDNPPTRLKWWSTYEISSPPERTFSISDMRAQLLDRHSSWTSPHDTPDAPVFRTIISSGCDLAAAPADSNDAPTSDKRLLVLPRYVIERLPSWCSPSGRIMLLGDAAHAMPPDAGQGASCAVEDAVAIGLLLKHFVAEKFDDAEAVRRTARGYQDVRMKRVGRIVDVAERRARNKKVQSWWQEWVRDWMLWLLCKLPEGINDRMFGYKVDEEVEAYIKSLSA